MLAGVPARWTLRVVAFGDVADPVRRLAGHPGQLGGRSPLGQQPQDLPPAAFVGRFGRALASLKLLTRELRLEMKVSSHAHMLQPPTTT
ncbi:MAG TPA: hypothetical protein VGS80_12345 [Ktedonobacterales bacterium]|nr:hypothetical protein [Ktedonobacterales bacterium]